MPSAARVAEPPFPGRLCHLLQKQKTKNKPKQLINPLTRAFAAGELADLRGCGAGELSSLLCGLGCWPGGGRVATASVVTHLARAVWQKWWAEWHRLQALAGCALQRSELQRACGWGRRAQPRFSARSVRRAGGTFVHAASPVRATADSRRASARGAASERRRGSRSKVVVHRVREFSAGRR